MINGNRILVKDSYSLPTSVPELSEENVGAEIFSLIIDILMRIFSEIISALATM